MDNGFALVVDDVSDICEVDFARDNVLSIAARFHHQGVRVSPCEKDSLVGNEAEEEKSTMISKYPIELGIITNWDDMEKILDHTLYREVCVAPLKNLALLTDNRLKLKADRTMATEIYIRYFQHLSSVRRNPRRVVPVRLRSYYQYRVRHWRRRHPRWPGVNRTLAT